MDTTKPGKFIVFEGIDGSGKSTQIERLAQRLEGLGCPHTVTREPTDGTVGRLIRQVLTGQIQMDNRAIAPLFVSDRLDHLTGKRDGLCAAIAAGTTVLCDRYYFSSYAYHSVDMPMEWVIGANSVCAQLLRPTVTIFIDLTPEVAMERIHSGREGTELFETQERLTQTREKYFQAFRTLQQEEHVVIVDGNQDVDSLAEAIWAQVAPILD